MSAARALMLMGTGSDVGKSLLVAGLCRAAVNRGLKVMPFKPQNMSNNAAVTVDGGEIGRAQALQARAARQDPITAMNPVLLKPEHETGAQVILRGQRVASMPARQYFAEREKYLKPVHQAFSELAREADLVLVEGAGSASEINLRHNDIANFGFARAAEIPVAIIGDVHRGGVIAALAGTLQVIDPEDAALVVATIVNKFHGDPALFVEGRKQIARLTRIPCFGPIPYFEGAQRLPAEDALGLGDLGRQNQSVSNGKILICVPRLPRIANFDDLDPLRSESGLEVRMIAAGEPIPRETDLIIIPGSKAVRADLDFVRQQGWDIDIAAHIRAGGQVLGICGGYQMLGQVIVDAEGLEGASGQSAGLGHLALKTDIAPKKQLRIEDGTDARYEEKLSGYHMHLGVTEGSDRNRPFVHIGGAPEGAMSADGRVMGTYLHGLFASDGFRRKFLNTLGATHSAPLNYEHMIEGTLDQLAQHLEDTIDVETLLSLATTPRLVESTK